MWCYVSCLVANAASKRKAVAPGPFGLATRESYSARRLGRSGKTRAGSFSRVNFFIQCVSWAMTVLKGIISIVFALYQFRVHPLTHPTLHSLQPPAYIFSCECNTADRYPLLQDQYQLSQTLCRKLRAQVLIILLLYFSLVSLFPSSLVL